MFCCFIFFGGLLICFFVGRSFFKDKQCDRFNHSGDVCFDSHLSEARELVVGEYT